MAANEFEKNARKLLDEFKLHPSEQVWQNVEGRIRENKRRRRIIFFIIFSCALLALGGYRIYEIQSTKSKARDLKGTDQINGLTKNTQSKRSGSPQSSSIATNQNRETEKKKIIQKTTIEKTQALEKRIAPKKDNAYLKREDHLSTSSSAEANMNEEKKSANDTSLSKTRNNSYRNEQKISVDTSGNAVTLTQYPKNTTVTNLVDSSSTEVAKETIANKKASNKNNPSKTKIDWGLNFSVGASTITQDHFSNANTNYSGGNLSSTPGSYGNGVSIYPQSANKPSFAFMLGVVLRKNISNRSSLLSGVQYSYMADKIKTGSLQTIPQSSYYQFSSYYGGGVQQTYTNHFHFIDVPLTYEWRVTNNTKHFLSLDASISVSFLLSTNALVYDTTAGGIYYHDKNSFAQAIVNFVPGLSYHFTAKKLKWSLGPQFYFDLNKFIKSDLDQRKYLLYGGINAKLFFEKKK